MGGEKLISWQTVPPLLGSPPHGRGKGDNHRSYESLTRITPAWAGKRGGFPSAIALSKDHPRMGGEKFQRSYSARISGGSPPHGRGKELCDSCLRIRQRITPAWAGKRLLGGQRHWLHRDHPRMGGEKYLVMELDLRAIGSPPHGRGKEKVVQRR